MEKRTSNMVKVSLVPQPAEGRSRKLTKLRIKQGKPISADAATAANLKAAHRKRIMALLDDVHCLCQVTDDLACRFVSRSEDGGHQLLQIISALRHCSHTAGTLIRRLPVTAFVSRG